MTLQQKIDLWLQSKIKDYEDGVYLFSRSSKNRSLKAYFSKPKNTSRMEKLIYELKKIQKLNPPKIKKYVAPFEDNIVLPEIKKAIVDPPKPTSASVKKKVESVSGDLAEIIQLKNSCFQKRNALRNSLYAMKTDEERHQAVIKIMEEYQPIIKDCWFKIDYHTEHGVLPAGVAVGDELRAKLRQRNSNLRTYMSKKKKKLLSAPKGSDEYNKLKDELTEMDSERKQIKIKLAK